MREGERGGGEVEKEGGREFSDRHTSVVAALHLIPIPGDANPSLDVQPSSGTILFGSGLNRVELSLSVLDDTEPELEETFTVILSQPTGGATLNPQADRATFTIR